MPRTQHAKGTEGKIPGSVKFKIPRIGQHINLSSSGVELGPAGRRAALRQLVEGQLIAPLRDNKSALLAPSLTGSDNGMALRRRERGRGTGLVLRRIWNPEGQKRSIRTPDIEFAAIGRKNDIRAKIDRIGGCLPGAARRAERVAEQLNSRPPRRNIQNGLFRASGLWRKRSHANALRAAWFQN